MSAANTAPADWPQDIPFYKWPPFPAKPDGVTITPFSQFVATGLKDDQDEDAPGVDQMGIPTVVLEARHDGEKKKRRKKKKGENGETIEVPLDWWEEFEEDAKNPRRLYKYNHDEPYMARLEQAWKDFTDNRRFPSHVLTVAQDLGEFLGLVKPKPKADKSAKKAGDDTNNDANDADNNAETANDSGDMSDDEPSPDEPVSAEKTGEAGDILESKIEEVPDPDVEKAKAEKKAKEQLQAAIERAIKAEIEREKALDAFYQDSEQVMKLYLTSHAYDRGIYWNDAKLRDTPMLVETFLNFLESNSVFGPKEEDVKHRMTRAKKVAQLAKQEMPHANKVARLFPDAWGMACADIWGKSIVGEWVFGQLPGEPQDAVSDEASTTSPTMTTAQTTPEIHDELPIDPVHGDGIIFEPTEAELLVDSIEPPSINGHQTEWTHASNGDAPGEEPPTWDANVEQFKEPPPEDPANVWGNLGPSGREQLETLIGRNNLPETYVTIRAESSSRIISSIIEPTPNPAANLEGASFAEIAQQRLARLTLSPSPYSKTAPEIGACINQPIMHNPPIDESKFGWVGPHDPLASDITLFVQSDAEFLETLRAGARMVVTGVFVQVAEITSPKDDEKEGKEAQAVGGEQPKKKKKKSKSAAADVRSWWFFSQMGEVYPTFFTE